MTKEKHEYEVWNHWPTPDRHKVSVPNIQSQFKKETCHQTPLYSFKPGRWCIKNFTCIYLGGDTVSRIFSLRLFLVCNKNMFYLFPMRPPFSPWPPQLTICYLDVLMTSEERRKQLRDQYCFECDCSRCQTRDKVCRAEPAWNTPGHFTVIFQRTQLLSHESKSKWPSVHSRRQKHIKQCTVLHIFYLLELLSPTKQWAV